MRSPVNWAVLGLVIERPSYAYELARRFERTYRGALSLSSTSHVYAALGALSDRGFVEELGGSREGRQPKPCYAASAEGLERYGDWLVAQVGEERRRQRLAVLQLVALKRRPEATGILARYEEALREEGPPAAEPAAGGEDGPEYVASLWREEQRLWSEAKLTWVAYARRQLTNLEECPGCG